MAAEKLLSRPLQWAARYLVRRGQTTLARQLFAAAGDASFGHAQAAWRAGDLDAAARLAAALLAKAPRHPEANNLLGAIHLRRNEGETAEGYFRKAIEGRPDYAAAHSNLGCVRQARQQWQSAIQCFREALDCDPDYPEALVNLGGALNTTGEPVAAERYCRRAVEVAPTFAGAWSNLGNALLSQGRVGEAVAAYREALRFDPSLLEASVNLYLVLQEPQYLIGVAEYYEERLKQAPRDYLAHVRIAEALQAQDQWEDGRAHLLEALAIRPDAVEVLVALGNNLAHLGDARASVDKYRECLRFGPHAGAHAGLVFHLHYLDESTGIALCDEAVRWAAAHTPSERLPVGFRRREGPLRIGYVSMDFATHSVAFYFEPILQHHNRDEFFVACYSTRLKPDATTERMQGMADLWRDISLSSLDEIESFVREDEIDILVDLSGYSSGNRLQVFARKPAPVQVTYLGYPGTTGIAAIDYRLTDEIADPSGVTDEQYTERLWRLPDCFLTYCPSEDAPEVGPLPAITKGYVVFGSFNNTMKMSPSVIRTWAAILAAVPDAKLLLKSYSVTARIGRDAIVAAFAEWGIGESRLIMEDWRASGVDHFSLYNEIDIALDPFPYNGTTTTCEALWMGVPVVTLVGDRHSCRVGASLLHCVGLDDLACASTEAYVVVAAALAKDTGRLRELRTSLRDRMRASPLLDHAGFTRKLEAAYQAMWKIYEQEAGDVAEPPSPLGEPVRLHIGGQQPKPGWKILNINPGPHVDYVGDVRDLSGFPANSVEEVYASHVLEHVDQNSMLPVLRGIRRILRKRGGRLMISVPDLEVLCRQFLKEGLGAPQRVHVMRMMFGGQTDAHDYHQIGLYYEYLADLLRKAGFRDIERVKSFDLFDDTSGYVPYGEPISLNVVAVA